MATLQDYYNTGDDALLSISGTSWVAQTFTASGSYSISSVKLLAYRVGTVSLLTVSLRDTTAGSPSGADITSGTLDISTLSTSASGVWVEVVFSTPYALSSGTQYAIVIRTNGANSTNCMRWRRDQTSPTYAGGLVAFSSDSGSTWDITSFAGSDGMFETYSPDVVDHEISGSVNLVLGQSGDLTGDFLIDGASALLFTGSGLLSGDVFITGSLAMAVAINSRLVKLFKFEQFSTNSRLVVAGSNQIWYESI